MLRKEIKNRKKGKIMKQNKQEEVKQKRNTKTLNDIPS